MFVCNCGGASNLSDGGARPAGDTRVSSLACPTLTSQLSAGDAPHDSFQVGGEQRQGSLTSLIAPSPSAWRGRACD